ncbi:DUF2510 domain-containing protein [Mycobacterium sp. E796]|uniref:DUF2510 domain-containing protein n=1 Tax=Mycobacterium sp. E796 TaxID=1834151 RepID=UPI0009ED1985|nr:DUF2510 domain-containing protein [Mycobacterium sp. E796]
MTTPNQPGWYDDPQDPNAQRFWDGRTWTPQRQRKPDARAPRPPVNRPQQPPPSAAPTQVTPVQPPPPRPNLPPSAAQTRAAPLPPLPPRPPAPTGPPRPPQPPNRPAPPGYSPPGARPGPDTPAQPGSQRWAPPGPPNPGAGAHEVPESLAAVKAVAARMSVPAWIVFGGLLVTVVSIFLPFATVSLKLFGRTLSSHGAAADGTAKFVVILLAVVAALLALPALSGSRMPASRLIGLSVVVGLLGALTFVWFHTVSTKNNEGEGFVTVTPAFGLMVYAAAVIVTAVGVVLLWMDRSKTRQV